MSAEETTPLPEVDPFEDTNPPGPNPEVPAADNIVTETEGKRRGRTGLERLLLILAGIGLLFYWLGKRSK